MAVVDFWNEEWKEIKFKDINEKEVYQISSYGRVRIFKPELNEWKILKSANVKGYRYFTFKSNIDWKHKITKPLHRLVAELYCEKPTIKTNFVIHLNYVKDNNYYKNLKSELLISRSLRCGGFEDYFKFRAWIQCFSFGQ
jgi:hypothetical protein